MNDLRLTNARVNPLAHFGGVHGRLSEEYENDAACRDRNRFDDGCVLVRPHACSKHKWSCSWPGYGPDRSVGTSGSHYVDKRDDRRNARSQDKWIG